MGVSPSTTEDTVNTKGKKLDRHAYLRAGDIFADFKRPRCKRILSDLRLQASCAPIVVFHLSCELYYSAHGDTPAEMCLLCTAVVVA